MTILEKKINYPFQGRNLFKEPETYFYSDCSSLTYVEDYIEYRKTKIYELSLSTKYNITEESFSPIHAKQIYCYVICYQISRTEIQLS